MLDSRDKGCCPCLQQPYVLVEQKPTDMSGSWPDLRAGNDLENASRTPHKLVGWVINLLLPSLLFLISLFCLFIWATVFLALLAILETCCSGSCLYKAPYHSTYFKVFNTKEWMKSPVFLHSLLNLPDIHLRNERKYSLYYILLIYKDDSIYLLFNGTKNIKKMIK